MVLLPRSALINSLEIGTCELLRSSLGGKLHKILLSVWETYGEGGSVRAELHVVLVTVGSGAPVTGLFQPLINWDENRGVRSAGAVLVRRQFMREYFFTTLSEIYFLQKTD